MSGPFLALDQLSVHLNGTAVVNRVSLTLAPGETLGLVGESGAGKTLLARAILGLLPVGARRSGSLQFDGRELAQCEDWKPVRGGGIGLLWQQAAAGLNPLRTVGQQIADVFRAHRHPPTDVLAAVGLSGWENAYPHQLSGGMAQRVGIARALAAHPRVLIADEPTSNLDRDNATAILDLLTRLGRERGMAMVLITHDLALAAQRCQRIAVLQAGQVVEVAETAALLAGPQHPYSRALLNVREVHDADPSQSSKPPLLAVSGLSKRYGAAGFDGFSFTIAEGEAVGLIGPSGIGKSTLAHLIARLIEPDGGRIVFAGQDITGISPTRAASAPWRRQIQIIFQEPHAALNPRATVREAVADPLARLGGLRGQALRDAAEAALRRVGLEPALFDRLPHQLSGGQAARVGIARAIALSPALLILDEPTAALDALTEGEIVRLLEDLRRDSGMAMLFISHDPALIRRLCSRVLDIARGSGL